MGRIRILVGVSVFWLGLSMLSDGLTTLILPDTLIGVTDEATKARTLGLVTFIGLVAGMLVQPVAGALSDRLRPRWGRRGTIALGLLLTLITLAAFNTTHRLLTVLLAYVLIQLALNIAQAGQQGLLPDLVPGRWRGMAAGLKGFMDVGGAMLGFVVLGQLLGNGRTGAALLTIAVVLVVTFLLSLILVREPPSRSNQPGDRVTLIDAFRLDRHTHRTFVWLVVSRFLFLLGTYAVGRFFLYFVADRLGMDREQAAEQAGLLLGGLALVTVLAALPAGWAADRFGRMPLMVGGAALSALGVVLLIVAESALAIFLFGSLMALGSAAFAAANWALTADLAPSGEAARFFGIANIGTAGAAAVAGLFGPLVDGANAITPTAGYVVVFIVAGALFVGSAAVLRGVMPHEGAVGHPLEAV